MSAVLFHFPFDPASRAARLALGEARLDWSETPVRPWEDGCPVASLNPSGMPPVLQVSDAGGRPLTLCEPAAILGWLEERTSEPFLLPADGALLTGDTVLGRGSAVIAHPDGHLGAYMASLARLAEVAERTEPV